MQFLEERVHRRKTHLGQVIVFFLTIILAILAPIAALTVPDQTAVSRSRLAVSVAVNARVRAAAPVPLVLAAVNGKRGGGLHRGRLDERGES